MYDSDAEGADQLFKLNNLGRQRPAGIFGLVRTVRRALAGAVDFDNVLVDVMGHRRLLFNRSSDLLVLIDDHADRTKDIFQRLLDLL
jgi:hypothetical protein